MPQPGDLVAQQRGRADQRVEAVALLDRAVADQREAVGAARGRAGGAWRRRWPRRPSSGRPSILRGVGAARATNVSRICSVQVIARSAKRMLGLLDRDQQPQTGWPARTAELHGEELRHALVQVEQDARAEQPRNGGGEHEGVRHRVHLYDVPAAPQVRAACRSTAAASAEDAVLQDVPRRARGALERERQPIDGDARRAARAAAARAGARRSGPPRGRRRPGPATSRRTRVSSGWKPWRITHTRAT